MTDTSPPPPSAVVLIVEDEPLQRLDMLDMVAEAGFAAVEACDADHAVAILEKRADIRIVFTDIDMPGSMDGLRLAACVRDRWPPIEIIITSSGRKPKLSDIPARAVFLPKPIDFKRAIDTMHVLFDEAARDVR
ncbi:response regulator [Sphingomonas rubra]|uniref:Response regulator receiver domain-containing protein n=1 Tax=Sphingomonas rubra TaxID=634430 RepID=A0A1I5QMU9_9SPHN|nr:response regulator [Sphingomonas rubra]SFP47186.1 Response regulator receiver domain-containing protein [Sphingomonas rubra]